MTNMRQVEIYLAELLDDIEILELMNLNSSDYYNSRYIFYSIQDYYVDLQKEFYSEGFNPDFDIIYLDCVRLYHECLYMINKIKLHNKPHEEIHCHKKA